MCNSQMTYRCRGEPNAKDGIIRGPPRKPLFQRQEDYKSFMQNDNDVGANLQTVGQIHNRVEQPPPQPQSAPPQPPPQPQSAPPQPQSTPISLYSPITPITNAATVSNTTTVIATNSTDGTCMAITDETGNPAKVNKVLHPKRELWFKKQKVVKKVTRISFKQFMDKPYNNWSKVPIEVRNHWWFAFRKEFSWDPSIAKLVKDKWKSKLNRRLTDVVSKLVNQTDYRPKWCPPSMIAALKKVRDNSPFKKESQQCSINRKNSSKGLSKHSQGSVSTKELKDKMTIENGGQKPKPSKVYKRAHTRKNGAFVDGKSEAFWNTLQQKQAANKESAEPKSEEEVYYEVAGGFDEKGRVYGIGSAVESYFEKPIVSNKYRKGKSQHVIDLENRVVQLTSENSQEQEILNDFERNETSKEANGVLNSTSDGVY